MRLVRTLGGRDGIRELMHPRFFERLSDRRFLLGLSGRSPEAAVATIQFLREFVDDSRRMWRRRPQVAEQLLDPNFLLDLSERSPESALILRDLGADLVPDDQGRLPFGRLWDPDNVESILGDWLSRPTRNPRGFAAALFLARQAPSPGTLRRLAEAVARAVDQESLALILPLAVWDDMRWLANLEEANDVRDTLLSAIPGVLPPGANKGQDSDTGQPRP